MAANLDMSNNRVNFAYTGDTTKIWHGMGNVIAEDAPLDEWRVAAGLDWFAKESPILFNNGDDMPTVFPDKKALFRSDTNAPLSIMSNDYRIVQPKEVLDFFHDLLENHDMKMSTAGSLFGGKRFFATAKLGEDFEVISGDKISGFLLLTTSLDGTLATTAKATSIRTVCSNTLTMALNESSKNMVKVTHSTDFDASKAKLELGLISDTQHKFIENMRTLATAKIETKDVRKFFQDQFYKKDVAVDEQHGSIVNKVNDLITLYNFGKGAEFSKGTLYGVLQATTDYFDHKVKPRSESAAFWNSFYTSDKIKLDIQSKLLEMA
jgi:phage/plasmid-like protein (TIGR03299 family)